MKFLVDPAELFFVEPVTPPKSLYPASSINQPLFASEERVTLATYIDMDLSSCCPRLPGSATCT